MPLVPILVLLLSCLPMDRRASSRRSGAQLQMETFEYVWERVGAVYPDPDMDGLDWQGVHAELYPQAKRARSADVLRPVRPATSCVMAINVSCIFRLLESRSYKHPSRNP